MLECDGPRLAGPAGLQRMAKLSLSVAVGDYDRTRALIDGTVQIDGVEPVIMTLPPEEIFFRALRHEAFDICELSLSSFTLKTAHGDCPYVGVPAFVSRAFRHTSIYVRTDRVHAARGSKGKRVGDAEYQLTANVWARAILEDDHGVKPSDITWVRGGIEEPGRPEKIAIALPPDVRLEDAPRARPSRTLLDAGEIDGFIGAAPAGVGGAAHPKVGWLFEDPTAAAKDYYGAPASSRSCTWSACAGSLAAASVAAGGGAQGLQQAKAARSRSWPTPRRPR